MASASQCVQCVNIGQCIAYSGHLDNAKCKVHSVWTVRAKFKVQSVHSVHSVWTVGPRSVSGCRASSAPSEPAAHCGKATLALISPKRCLLGFGRKKIISKVISVLFSDECHLIVPTCCQAVHPHQQLVHPQSKKELPTHVL